MPPILPQLSYVFSKAHRFGNCGPPCYHKPKAQRVVPHTVPPQQSRSHARDNSVAFRYISTAVLAVTTSVNSITEMIQVMRAPFTFSSRLF